MEESKVLEKRLAICKQLYDTAKLKGITHDEIATRAGFTESNVSRMLSGKYAPTLDNLILLCEAVGVRLVLK